MLVYLLTNSVNDKYYVGQTIQPWKVRWTLHKSQAKHGQKTSICSAIRKYGSEAFSMQVLSEATSQPQLNNLEILWIILLDARNSAIAYNQALGGEGGKPMLGRKFSEEHRRKIGETRKGVPFTEEHKQHLRDSHKDNPRHGQFWRGKKFSDEHRQHLSIAAQRRKLGKSNETSCTTAHN